jgi:acyl-CoA reductase-like NAD-dependent aldehyde dehydrogenase
MNKVWYWYGMAAVKSTYSLDPQSLRRLNRLAKEWQVSKTEVLRRALKQAAEERKPPMSAEKRLAILRSLQDDLRRRKVDFGAWKRTIALARR